MRPPSAAARILLRSLIALGLMTAFFALPARANDTVDISGAMPDLAFSMTRASDGREVTAEDYRGKAVLLYFGFTHCPDICPLTLSNLTRALAGLEPETADDIRVLLVTVDLERDDLETLDHYQQAFAPQVDALRGTANQMTALAKRYRVAHSVRRDADGAITDVMHGAAVYGFDASGRVRELFSGLSDSAVDIPALRRDLRDLVDDDSAGGWFANLF